MSVHFYYNYKEDLVKQLKEHYSEDIKRTKEEKREQNQLNDVEKYILNYFKDIKAEIAEVIDSSKGAIVIDLENELSIVEFTIGENYLKLVRKEKSIEVIVGNYVEENDMTESTVLGYIVPGEKKAITKKLGKIHDGSHFDESTLSYYLRSAFGNVFNDQSNEKLDA
ncbi:MAG: hypothetical protein WBA54_09075 [Acidaminobacteraceae bacterium]